jgi:hypothetical protein
VVSHGTQHSAVPQVLDTNFGSITTQQQHTTSRMSVHTIPGRCSPAGLQRAARIPLGGSSWPTHFLPPSPSPFLLPHPFQHAKYSLLTESCLRCALSLTSCVRWALIDDVKMGREYALLGNYDTSLVYYEGACQALKKKVRSCTVHDEIHILFLPLPPPPPSLLSLLC